MLQVTAVASSARSSLQVCYLSMIYFPTLSYSGSNVTAPRSQAVTVDCESMGLHSLCETKPSGNNFSNVHTIPYSLFASRLLLY